MLEYYQDHTRNTPGYKKYLYRLGIALILPFVAIVDPFRSRTWNVTRRSGLLILESPVIIFGSIFGVPCLPNPERSRREDRQERTTHVQRQAQQLREKERSDTPDAQPLIRPERVSQIRINAPVGHSAVTNDQRQAQQLREKERSNVPDAQPLLQPARVSPIGINAHIGAVTQHGQINAQAASARARDIPTAEEAEAKQRTAEAKIAAEAAAKQRTAEAKIAAEAAAKQREADAKRIAEIAKKIQEAQRAAERAEAERKAAEVKKQEEAKQAEAKALLDLRNSPNVMGFITKFPDQRYWSLRRAQQYVNKLSPQEQRAIDLWKQEQIKMRNGTLANIGIHGALRRDINRGDRHPQMSKVLEKPLASLDLSLRTALEAEWRDEDFRALRHLDQFKFQCQVEDFSREISKAFPGEVEGLKRRYQALRERIANPPKGLEILEQERVEDLNKILIEGLQKLSPDTIKQLVNSGIIDRHALEQAGKAEEERKERAEDKVEIFKLIFPNECYWDLEIAQRYLTGLPEADQKRIVDWKSGQIKMRNGTLAALRSTLRGASMLNRDINRGDRHPQMSKALERVLSSLDLSQKTALEAEWRAEDFRALRHLDQFKFQCQVEDFSQEILKALKTPDEVEGLKRRYQALRERIANPPEGLEILEQERVEDLNKILTEGLQRLSPDIRKQLVDSGIVDRHALQAGKIEGERKERAEDKVEIFKLIFPNECFWNLEIAQRYLTGLPEADQKRIVDWKSGQIKTRNDTLAAIRTALRSTFGRNINRGDRHPQISKALEKAFTSGFTLSNNTGLEAEWRGEDFHALRHLDRFLFQCQLNDFLAKALADPSRLTADQLKNLKLEYEAIKKCIDSPPTRIAEGFGTTLEALQEERAADFRALLASTLQIVPESIRNNPLFLDIIGPQDRELIEVEIKEKAAREGVSEPKKVDIFKLIFPNKFYWEFPTAQRYFREVLSSEERTEIEAWKLEASQREEGALKLFGWTKKEILERWGADECKKRVNSLPLGQRAILEQWVEFEQFKTRISSFQTQLRELKSRVESTAKASPTNPSELASIQILYKYHLRVIQREGETGILFEKELNDTLLTFPESIRKLLSEA